MQIKNIFWVLFLFSIMSCNSILKIAYGFTKPVIENHISLIDHASKFGFSASNIITVSSENFPAVINGNSIPDAVIYNAKGECIQYKQPETSCNAALTTFIPSLNTKQFYLLSDKPLLKEELEKFRDLKGNRLPRLEQADFYVLIYWSVWTGKLNKDHVKVWERLVSENKNSNVKVLKVNLDVQEYWEVNDREKIYKAMRNMY